MADQVRVFVSHHHSPEEDTFTAHLVADLKTTGADVWVDTSDLTYDDFIKKINEGMSGRQWLVLVMTPDSLRSSWVQAEVNAAIQLVHQGRMRGVIPVVARAVEEAEVPILWGPLHRYDATQNYAAAQIGLFRALGLSMPIPAQPTTPSPPVPSPNPIPQTRIVDASGHGQHQTIHEALYAANDGDRILVRPGVYREALRITKSVEVVGEGGRDRVILEAGVDTTITFRALNGKLVGLTVRQLAEDDPRFSAVWQASGKLELSDCALTSASSLCLSTSGTLLLRHCNVHDCKEFGISIYSGATATVEDSEITRTAGHAVTVMPGATAILRRNRIVDNTGIGILVSGDGTFVAEDNDLRGNHPAWVNLDSAKVTLARNQE